MSRRIPLTQEDLESIEQYAKVVYGHKGLERSLKHQYNDKDPLENDKKGYTGELAVHNHLGIEMPEFNPVPTKVDIVLSYNNRELVCDIKTTVYNIHGEYGWDKIFTVNDKDITQNLETIEYNKEMHRMYPNKPELIKPVIDAYIAVEVDKEYKWTQIHGIISWKKFMEKKQPHTFGSRGVAQAVFVEQLLGLNTDFKYVRS